MDKKIIGTLSFIFGAVAGAIGAKLYFEKKYQTQMTKNIDEIRAYYKKKDEYITYSKPEEGVTTDVKEEQAPEKRAALKAREKPEVVNYAAMAKELGYRGEEIPVVAKNPAAAPKPPKEANLRPYIISYDEYGRKDGQDISSLTYYTCGTLAEDDDTVLSRLDIERIVTKEILDENFSEEIDEGLGHDNSIYVRNNLLHCDYEILRDSRSYFEVVGDMPEDRME